MDRDEKPWLFALIAFALLVRLPFLTLQPLTLDEALYAKMTEETAANPALIPHYLGQEVAWRPPLFFFLYAPFSESLSHLGAPVEVVYRLPTAVLGALCVLLLYLFARREWGRDVAYAACLFFAGSGLVLYANTTALTDTLLVFFMLLSLNYYALGKDDRRMFLAAGLFAACAFLVKTVVAFIIPVVAVAYIATRKREALAHPFFIASLLMVAIAFAGYYLAFEDRQAITDEYFHNVANKLPDAGGADFYQRFVNSAVPFIALSFFMLGFYVSGAWALRKDLFVAAWLVMGLFALFGGQWMPWYFLPIAPILSVCAGYFIAGKGLDGFAKFVIGMCMAVMLLGTYYVFATMDLGANGERDAGLYLAGKENVLIAGAYMPSVVFYKEHAEAAGGGTLPFCWRIVGKGVNLSNPDYAVLAVFNYSAGVENYRLTDIFWRNAEFGLPCNISRFDYVALKRADCSGLLGKGYAVDGEFANNITVLKRVG